MGDELKKNFNADVEYKAGSGGIFEIAVNGKEVFSKAKTGRFPETKELIDSIKKIS